MRSPQLLGLLVAAVLGAAVLEIFALQLLAPLENRLLDSFVRWHALRLAPDPDIVIVDIDEKSLARMQQVVGSWPWPRAVHAELIEGLAAQQPRAIVFDILFTEDDKFRPESDALLAQAALRHGQSYFPMVRLAPRDDANFPPVATIAKLLGLKPQPDAAPDARVALLPPLVLPPEAWRTGTINFIEDADGVGRRYGLRTVAYGWEIPSLAARVARDLGWRVPDADDLLLAWRGPKGAFRHVSYAELYEDFNRSQRQRPQDEFRGKVVLVGTAASGLQDLRVTPIDSLHPGVEILATALDNLKGGRSMRRAPPAVPAAIALGLIALLAWAFGRNVDANRTGFALLGASLALLAASWLAAGDLLLLPLLAPLAASWTFYLASAAAAYLRERRERQETIAQFSRFVNPHVVQQLLERGGLEGAGQTRNVTLLFSDIRGFTTLSEQRPPHEIVTLLNRYFSLQVDVVFRHGGSLDKFIGDAIMAFWGAPLDDPEHARHAIDCALEMADTLQAFKAELGPQAASFDVGIGIHSGPAVVGLIGSDKRREYTAIGDTVNLASRIEGLTKEAGRRILVSRETMSQCADAFEFVGCGSFKAKGRAQGVELFEPRRKR